jgi:hypothetical protein
MKLNKLCFGATAAVILTMTAASVQATPLSGTGKERNIGAANAFPVEKAAYRRCWTRYGVRHCRWVDYYDDYRYDGPYYDYGPGVSLSFGGRGGHFHGGHFGGGHHH